MSDKTVIVFVHGGWHGPSCWGPLMSRLDELGQPSIAVDLPTCHGDPAKECKDDIDVTRKTITDETSQGRDVIVVAHSYGGIVGSSAIKGLARSSGKDLPTVSEPSENGGHVIGYVLMSTGFAPAGKTFLDNFGGTPPPFFRADEESGFAVLQVDERQFFYHDLPEEEGNAWVSRLRPLSLKALTTGADAIKDGWKDVPCYYLAASQDVGFPVDYQKMAVQRAREEDGADVVWKEFDASHSAMLSKTRGVADVLIEAVADFARRR